MPEPVADKVALVSVELKCVSALTSPLNTAVPAALIVAAVPSTLLINSNPFPVTPVEASHVPPKFLNCPPFAEYKFPFEKKPEIFA